MNNLYSAIQESEKAPVLKRDLMGLLDQILQSDEFANLPENKKVVIFRLRSYIDINLSLL